MLVKPGHGAISRRLDGNSSNIICRCGRLLLGVVATKRCLLALARLLARLLLIFGLLLSLRLRIDLKLKGWFEELRLIVVATWKMNLTDFPT